MIFKDFCERENVKLLPHQIDLATAIIAAVSHLPDNSFRKVFQKGGGASTVFFLLEKYFKILMGVV